MAAQRRCRTGWLRRLQPDRKSLVPEVRALWLKVRLLPSRRAYLRRMGTACNTARRRVCLHSDWTCRFEPGGAALPQTLRGIRDQFVTIAPESSAANIP